MRTWMLALSNSLLDDYPLTLRDEEFVQQLLHKLFRHHQPANIEIIEGERVGDDISTEVDSQ